MYRLICMRLHVRCFSDVYFPWTDRWRPACSTTSAFAWTWLGATFPGTSTGPSPAVATCFTGTMSGTTFARSRFGTPVTLRTFHASSARTKLRLQCFIIFTTLYEIRNLHVSMLFSLLHYCFIFDHTV